MTQNWWQWFLPRPIRSPLLYPCKIDGCLKPWRRQLLSISADYRMLSTEQLQTICYWSVDSVPDVMVSQEVQLQLELLLAMTRTQWGMRFGSYLNGCLNFCMASMLIRRTGQFCWLRTSMPCTLYGETRTNLPEASRRFLPTYASPLLPLSRAARWSERRALRTPSQGDECACPLSLGFPLVGS